jgi:hypothetical protein
VLKEGDCWSYASRPGEEASFLVIRKIEQLPKIGEVVHVSIFGVKIKSSAAPGGYTDRVGHMPILSESLRKSLREKIEKSAPNNDWAAGYRTWREAFDSGKAGAFSKPVRECISFIEEALSASHT